uniref:Secreted protein n=1 Tax=Steinernema glaseri TaxID=37863 RepID=A0A1I7Z0L9_9BILA
MIQLPTLFLFVVFELTQGCLRSPPGGGGGIHGTITPKTTTSTSTTTTMMIPRDPRKLPEIFVGNSVENNMIVFGEEEPLMKMPCEGGTRLVFSERSESDWKRITADRRYALRLLCPGKSACVCVSPDECYRPSVNGMEQAFVPFCKQETCAVYMSLSAGEDGWMEPAGRKGTAFSSLWEFYGEKGEYDKPLPGDYKTITSIGCGRCPVATKC